MTELCSIRSGEVGEPIGGTAVASTAVWIVLEHRGPWGAKAVAESCLPEAVKGQLMAWEASIAGARVQLVRRLGRSGSEDESVRFWVGVSDLGASRMVERTLTAVETLLALDVPAQVEALRRGEAIEGARVLTEPLVLVCTNGRRDVCCSKLGVPVVQALVEQAGLDVWQTTHLGGHRFAATLLHLPEGLCYGRVQPDEAAPLAAAIAERRVFRLDRLRGRTALADVEQAAESIWRERSGRLELDALVHVGHVSDGDTTVVALRDREGTMHELRLAYRALEHQAPKSCGMAPTTVGGWFAQEG